MTETTTETTTPRKRRTRKTSGAPSVPTTATDAGTIANAPVVEEVAPVAAPVVDDHRIRPADLRSYDGPLYVTNKRAVILSLDDNKGNTLRLDPMGSAGASGVLPLEIAKWPPFQTMWRKSYVTVTSDPAFEEELLLADMRQSEAERQKAEQLNAIMEKPASAKDLSPIPCAECSAVTFQSQESTEAGVPALCVDHQHLQSSYVQEKYYDTDSKTEKTRYVRPGMTATVVGPSE